jgi:hypothetical protein
VLFAAIPFAWAHGVPEKVVDDLVVSLVLVPGRDAEALRFFFRDRHSGRLLAVPITYRVRLRDDATGAEVEESPGLTTTIGRGDFVPRVPRAGRHEVLLEVERSDRAGRIYRPEDWLVAMGERESAGRVPAGWVLASGLGVLVAVAAWQGMRRRRRRLEVPRVAA